MKREGRSFGLGIRAVAALVGGVAAIAGPLPPGPELRITYSRKSGFATFISAPDGNSIPVASNNADQAPRDFLLQYGDLFGVSDTDSELVQVSQKQDAFGFRRTQFQQVFGGVEVFSGILNVHQNDAGAVISANGRFHPIKRGLDVQPHISLEQAHAASAAKSANPAAALEYGKLVIVDPGWYGDAAMGAHLAWHLVLADLSVAYREAFFIDAQSGLLLDRWSLVENAQFRRVHNGNGGAALPGILVRTEGDPPSGLPQADAAYDYAGDVYGFYWRAFGRDGLDDAGATLTATVHSSASLCPNAYWTGFQTVFCDGAVSDDILAHEFQHGVTQYTANLIYQNQPGQINEAYSDIFGELIDLYNGNVALPGPALPPLWPPHPTGSGVDQSNNLRSLACSFAPGYSDGVRWLIAEGAPAFSGAIRDMWNPPCHGDPDRAYSLLQTCSEPDNGGVHSGSGIVNHAFSMLMDGKTFNGRTVPSIGPIKAGAIWYRALTAYLTVASDFEDLALALHQSAVDLLGTFPLDPRTGFPSDFAITLADVAAVDQSVFAAELNTPGRCGAAIALLDPTSPLSCPGATVLLKDNFEEGASGWSTQTTGPAGPPTPYTWELRTGGLPENREGTAWFCADPTLGNCTSQNESAVHSLVTPPIALPPSLTFPRLSFAHYMASEPTYDGGNVSVRVSGGAWQLIPFTAFEYNAYSAYLRPFVLGNSNPRAGEPAWTSAGGGWGTTLIDLGSFVSGGDTLQIRFDFSKDGCNGVDGWYIDDVIVYDCPDCDHSLLPDNLDYFRTFVSGTLGPIGATVPQTATMEHAARAAGPVTLRLDASADLGADLEYIDVFLNNVFVGQTFGVGSSECALWPNEAVLVLSPGLFNFALAGSDVAQIEMIPSADVSVNSCGNSYINVSIHYEVDIDDQNADGIIDACEDCQPNGVYDVEDLESGASQDCNANQNPDECDLAKGDSFDANANNIPDECDCAVPAAPLPEVQAACGGCYIPKNRYLSVIAPPVPAIAESVALRVRMLQLPGADDCPAIPDFSAFEGIEMWVGQEVINNGVTPTGVYELQSTPHFRDWTTVAGGVVHITDCNIVPCATYLVDAVSDACDPFFDPYSSAITLTTTTVWADIVGATMTAVPNNLVDFTDISALVDRFRNQPTAPHASRCDLGENRPNGGNLLGINFLDISHGVDAFRGRPYHFSGPTAPLPCP